MHSRDIDGIQSDRFAHGIINRVPLTVRTLTKGSQPTATPISVLSPLYDGCRLKDWETCFDAPYIAPFWAVLPSPGGFHRPNMGFETSVFTNHGFHGPYGSYPKLPGGMRYDVEFTVLRNLKHISKGDVLTFQRGIQ